MTRPLVKICGLKFQENLEAVLELSPDYVGFIFASYSPRYVGDGDIVSETIANLSQVKTVGVFVDEEVERVLDLASQGGFDVVQLHGSESVEYIGELRKGFSGEVWKALSVKDSTPSFSQYEEVCDKLLFDTHTKQGGGSGEKFSWSLLPEESASPFFLAGGISSEDASSILDLFQCYHQLCGVDLNSKFESEPGRKDVALLSTFLEEFRT